MVRQRKKRIKRSSPSSQVDNPNGRVIGRVGPVFHVVDEQQIQHACIANGPGKAAVIGDRVLFTLDADSDLAPGLIRGVAARSTTLQRADAMGRRVQVIAANVDQVVIVCAVEPEPREGLIDRYLVTSHAQGINAHILLNKTDLLEDDAQRLSDLKARMKVYGDLGYPVTFTSARTAEGLASLQAALHGRCSILVGHSGVGKTSILNTLIPDLDERVQTLSDSSGKGQHTTTTSALYTLSNGSEVIDSPGIRSFGLWGLNVDEIKDHFVEFAERASMCRFGDCQHVGEPGCAIKEALDGGEISSSRYESYLRLRASVGQNETRRP